jgi:hypothetical protein
MVLALPRIDAIRGCLWCPNEKKEQFNLTTKGLGRDLTVQIRVVNGPQRKAFFLVFLEWDGSNVIHKENRAIPFRYSAPQREKYLLNAFPAKAPNLPGFTKQVR